MRKVLRFVVILLPSLVACRAERKNVTVLVPSGFDEISSFFDGLDLKSVRVKICDDFRKCAEDDSVNVAVEEDRSCRECYLLEDRGDFILVRGGRPLGMIYGVVHLLEAGGLRFPHPFFYIEPEKVDEKRIKAQSGKKYEPHIPLRGLHLHTLHPIEALFSFHALSDEQTNFDEAKKVIDWIVLQRGNLVQWVPLGDIKAQQRFAEWRRTVERITEYSHRIGVKVGINLQIFAISSLQNAYLLVEDKDYEILNLPFDIINLSFGEFFGEEPETFVREVNRVFRRIKQKIPNVEVHATVHVGNFEKLWVEYRGQRLLYYFLVKFVDPEIIPLVHTVMFYNLFDSAGGAYNHRDFREHREFLFELHDAGRKVGYKPETAYWVSFDNPVPLYLPIYVLSRWFDVHEILKRGSKIHAHVIFSSGWEWGYWMNDYASLRISYYDPPVTFTDVLVELFEPAEDGRKVAELIGRLAEVQYEYLLRRELAAYPAGEDFYVDLACSTKVIISQPCRVSFDELKNLPENQSSRFKKDVLDGLKEFEVISGELADQIEKLDEKGAWAPLIRELKDGARINHLRTKFIRTLYEGILQEGDKSGYINTAQELIERARGIVERRYNEFFYPRRDLLVMELKNPTIYKYGYLKQAHTLCLWQRDLERFKKAVGIKSSIPTCIH